MKKRKKRTQKLSEKLKKKKHPFIVHADPLTGDSPYPTHSHGLHDIGWPEFFIDPLAFGPHGNAGLINAVYKYFKKPKNQKKLQDILNGEVVELTGKQLVPKAKANEAYIFCFRLAPHDFEGLKQAYDVTGSGIDQDMKFVQIWVKGDDFALMDEYYQGGIKW